MRFALSFFLVLSLTTSGCAPVGELLSSDATTTTPQATIPISNASGEVVASQPGPQWVLLSGVDEHGLLSEPQLELLALPRAETTPLAQLPSGIAAAVLEIRHLGPQSLQRFYRVEAVSGEIGWISDYYVRPHAYLFNIGGTSVPLHSSAVGSVSAHAPNVTPVLILDPASSTGWWLVRTIDEDITGWVLAEFVKESSEEEFLLSSGAHEHDDAHQ